MLTMPSIIHHPTQTKYSLTIHPKPLCLLSAFLCAGLLLSGCQTPSNPATATLLPRPGASPTTAIIASDTVTPLPTETSVPSTTPAEPPTLAATTPPGETSAPSPTATVALAGGATQVSDQDGMLLVYVPAGEFVLGSRPDDIGADEDEFPQRTIYLDAFWIDQTEVTNAMYAAFLNETGGHITGEPAWLNSVKETVQIIEDGGQWLPIVGLENHPVVEVTWYGAEAYCTWAGRRLPTEAEWEKAARGSDGRTYPWGEEIDCSKALYGNCPESHTIPVGSLPGGASPYGTLDMAGNVWEWVADWYTPDAYAKIPDTNPTGPETGTVHVVRGGSFDYNAKHNRATDRRNDGPANSSYDYGFRCVMNATP